MIPHNRDRFVLNIQVCHKCSVFVEGKCAHDGVDAAHHANAGFCPIGKFAENQPKPDCWDALEKQSSGIPFTPRTPAEEIVPLLAIDHPHPKKWTRWPNVQNAYGIAVRAAIDSMPDYPGGDGRGIVIVAGGKYWASGIITAQMCRHVGIDLPIEMWHLPGEISAGQRAYTEALGITLREGSARGGWELKPHALANSRFEEILFLDADSYPARALDDFWACDEFKWTGLLFFPDRPSPLHPGFHPGDRLKPEVFNALDLPWFNQRTVEAGQFFVNRRTHWRTLWLADWMAQHSAYVFQWLYGDKDLWWLAARRLGPDVKYSLMPTFWDREGPAMIHYDWADQVCFVHRCHGKWDLYGTGFTSTIQQQQREDLLPLESQAWDAFAKLQKDMKDDVREWQKKHPRITAITICINFADFLERTFAPNRRHFDDFIVVTEADDDATRSFCHDHGIRHILSDRKNAGGSAFNLGALRNDGIGMVEGGYICFVDADVILPGDWRQKLESGLDEAKIYGMRRRGHTSEAKDSAISGFFQLFHSSLGRRYREDFPDAGFSDTAFRDLWAPADRIVLDLHAHHLGETAVHWKGRKSPEKFDGPAIWDEIHAMPFLPDLSIVPARLAEIAANLPRFSCSCRKGAIAYLRDHPVDISSPAAVAEHGWRWHNHVRRKQRKPEMAWLEAVKLRGWEKVLAVQEARV